MKKTLAAVFAVFFICLSAPLLPAQSDAAKDTVEPIVWPQFAQDLRRFDVVTFGLFPFAFLVSSLGYDLVRSAQNNWDAAYYPWPLNSGGSSWGAEDYGNVLAVSAVVSLSVAAVDLIIVWIKRHAAAKKEEARSRPETDIRRMPLYEE